MAEQSTALIKDAMTDRIVSVAERLVTANGADDLTVRKILRELGISNRVFYNRFHNIDEVLGIVYRSTVIKIRESITSGIEDGKDFFECVSDMVVNALTKSYDKKMHFNEYFFASDSVSMSNYEWWTAEIKKLIEFAKSKGYVKDVDSDIVSYSIWCFCRGYNADAVGRNLPKEQAVAYCRYGFGIMLDGLRLVQ